MKALQEVGITKAFRFVFFQLIQVIIDLLFIPQIRVILLKLLGANIGKNCLIYKISFMNLYRGSFSNLTIGDNCFIGNDVLFDLAGKIKIGQNVTISDRSILLTHMNVGYKNHPLQKVFPSYISKIKIENNVFIGVGVIILPTVNIGQTSVIGAGSVITSDIESFKVVAGVPGKVIKTVRL